MVPSGPTRLTDRHAGPERWHVVNVFDADAAPVPLRFATLLQARTYVAQTLGTLRVVRVTDEGGRVPMETGAT